MVPSCQRHHGLGGFLGIALFLLGSGLRAQAVPDQRPLATARGTAVIGKDDAQAGAVEPAGLSYMGRKLWFEVRRRLNLTTAEEEARQKADARQVRVQVGSIRLQTLPPARDQGAPQPRRASGPGTGTGGP
jgi:hypothetical protein